MQFEIVSIYRSTSELVSVKVRMPAKDWNASRKALGHLYGVDISNHVYRSTGIKAYQPIVDDKQRSKGGYKIIELTYIDSEWTECNNVVRVDFVARRKAA